MKTANRFTLFTRVLGFLLTMSVVPVCGTAMGQEQSDEGEFMLEDIIVSAQFEETKLQETPIAITAVNGERLELQNIQDIRDLGWIVPNADIRQTNANSGPNTGISLRGVGLADHIPAFEPGVIVYVDDVAQETLIGSTLDLLDLERVEVLRGPQGTLFGKNTLGGAIRLISKTPKGTNTGHLQVTYGELHRLDFSGAYDVSLIEDKLFARISGVSKRIDGYVDRLDFPCQMKLNGTPELAGTLPQTLRSHDMTTDNCKIGEKGGKITDAAKIMFRFLARDKLEINFGADYTDILADSDPATMLKGYNPDSGSPWDQHVDSMYQERYGVSIFGDNYVTGDPYTNYEDFLDKITFIQWPDKFTEEHKNMFLKVDYDITDKMHLKWIYGYRAYQQVFATCQTNYFCINGHMDDMRHRQNSYEVRLNGEAFNDRLDWTIGGYYFDSMTHFAGFISLGTFGIAGEDLGIPGAVYGFDNNDRFTTDSRSAFVHGIFAITDKLSLTLGGRYTDEKKSFYLDHPGQVPNLKTTLWYGQSHEDWKVSLDYQFTEEIMGYFMASTGFRSEGANPRTFTIAQFQPITGEEILAYEIGAKTEFFDKRLRVNAAAFYNDYDPRQFMVMAGQCTDPAGLDPGEPVIGGGFGSELCPEGTFGAGGTGIPWLYYLSAPGTSKGLELDITALPIRNLDINASFGYYNYETDVGPDDPGYVHPDYKMEPEFNYSLGAQYRIHFNDGSMLIPRIDMFYQGERNNSSLNEQPVAPYHVVPDYTVYNARLTYMPSDVRWSISLEVQNLFDTFYWIDVGPERSQDLSMPSYNRQGIPSPPRQVGITIRYDIF